MSKLREVDSTSVKCFSLKFSIVCFEARHISPSTTPYSVAVKTLSGRFRRSKYSVFTMKKLSLSIVRILKLYPVVFFTYSSIGVALT